MGCRADPAKSSTVSFYLERRLVGERRGHHAVQRADTSGRQRPLFVSEFGKYPIPDTACEIARGDRVASFKMRNESLEGACSRFDRLYGILSDRFGPVKISRRREGQQWFSPDLFARLKQTDDHLGVDLYVEGWSKHPDPHMRRGGIILNIYMRDLRLDEPARTLTCRNLAGCTSDMHRIRLEDGRRRRLSVREAARLQSFPDWYEFSGTNDLSDPSSWRPVDPSQTMEESGDHFFKYVLKKSLTADIML